MRSRWRNKLVAGVIAAGLLAGVPAVYAAETLHDVEAGSWYEGHVQWAVSKRIVNGYEDQTFRPYAQVTEAEFLAMLLRSYGVDVRAAKPGEPWFGPYYEKARALAIPVSKETGARLQPILRGRVAVMIAAYFGNALPQVEAVQFILSKGISHGKTASTIDGYRMDDVLSRAEGVTFVRNVVVFAETEEGRKLLTPTTDTKKPSTGEKPSAEPTAGATPGGGTTGSSSGDGGSSTGDGTIGGQTRPQTPVITAETRAVLGEQAKDDIAKLGLTVQESGQTLKVTDPLSGGNGLIFNKNDETSGEIQLLDGGSAVLLRSAHALLASTGVTLSEADFSDMVDRVNSTGSSMAVKLGSQMITVLRTVPSGTFVVRYAAYK